MKSSLLPRVLLFLAVVAVLLVVVGLYFVFASTSRYNELAAIDLQPLIATMKENATNAQTVASVQIRMRQAQVAREEAFAIVGGGAILLGLVSLVYSRIPNKSASSVAT